MAVHHLVHSSEQLRLSATASVPTFVAPTTAVAGAAQEGEELLAETGAPPRVDYEIGRRVDGKQEVREGDDVLDEGRVGAVAAVADRLGRDQPAVDHLKSLVNFGGF